MGRLSIYVQAVIILLRLKFIPTPLAAALIEPLAVIVITPLKRKSELKIYKKHN